MSDLTLGVEARVYNATIRSRRKELGLTQRELAARAGVSMSIVNHLETLYNTRITPSARKVLAVLGLDESASPAWLEAADLYGKKTIERPADELLLASPERLLLGAPAAEDDGPIVSDDARRILMSAIEELPQPRRRVLECLYGFGEYEYHHRYSGPLSLDEVARIVGLTRERVRQIDQEFKRDMRSCEELANEYYA